MPGPDPVQRYARRVPVNFRLWTIRGVSSFVPQLFLARLCWLQDWRSRNCRSAALAVQSRAVAPATTTMLQARLARYDARQDHG